ncbi:unnamed protein product [Notodromas monacha]|uniref:Germinal-center associated nuclear protein n=1 Tax=Notodromas monacha TaxID=399045 RepID=A0A7R9BCD3_9CRUS|nr:unnamed protein product [Notodromas monacha]CAG0912675.1 unnamed protein product [Notodromas monacha]
MSEQQSVFEPTSKSVATPASGFSFGARLSDAGAASSEGAKTFGDFSSQGFGAGFPSSLMSDEEPTKKSTFGTGSRYKYVAPGFTKTTFSAYAAKDFGASKPANVFGNLTANPPGFADLRSTAEQNLFSTKASKPVSFGGSFQKEDAGKSTLNLFAKKEPSAFGGSASGVSAFFSDQPFGSSTLPQTKVDDQKPVFGTKLSFLSTSSAPSAASSLVSDATPVQESGNLFVTSDALKKPTVSSDDLFARSLDSGQFGKPSLNTVGSSWSSSESTAWTSEKSKVPPKYSTLFGKSVDSSALMKIAAEQASQPSSSESPMEDFSDMASSERVEDGCLDDEHYESDEDGKNPKEEGLHESESASSRQESPPNVTPVRGKSPVETTVPPMKSKFRTRKISAGFEPGDFTALSLKNVPPSLNQRYLQQYYSKYGDVSRVTVYPLKRIGYVYFHDAQIARLAKTSSKDLIKAFPGLSVLLYKPNSPRTRSVLPKSRTEPYALPKVRQEEPSESSVAEPVVVSSGTLEKNFVELCAVPAHSAEQRWKILDVRDRLLKLYRDKKRNLADYLVGTCPDMCPEKERYLRCYQNILTPFEKSSSRENSAEFHRYCVKEYSRSSADQEEPLSHDLRPIETLQKAMIYLLSNVLDKFEHYSGDLPIEEWYNFLWDRMRAIRKDITQQQLTGPIAVELIEICVRFHILACAVMAMEAVHVFDPKINDENLTKSLTTVLQMYEDGKKENCRYPNEAEFRAYYVLLRADRGDTLRKIQTLDPAIRKTPLVQLSIKICGTLSSRNYVRFFMLIRDPTLPILVSAILMRYFWQVRSEALRLLVFAVVSSKKKPVNLRISDLKKWLGFDDESEEEVIAFCQAHNLMVQMGRPGDTEAGGFTDDANEVSNCVLLDRNLFKVCQDSLPTSASLVWKKKGGENLSQIVLGGKPLDASALDALQPHDSFDLKGFLKESSKLARDQGCQIIVPTSVLEATQPSSDQPFVRFNAQPREAKFGAASLLDVQLKREMEEKKRRLREVLINRLADQAFEEMLDSVIQGSVRVIALSEKTKAREAEVRLKMELEREKLREAERLAALRQTVINGAAVDLLAEVLKEEMKKLCGNAISCVRTDNIRAALEQMVPALVSKILDDVVDEEVKLLTEDEISIHRFERDALVERMREKRNLRLLAKYSAIWMKFARVRALLRRAEKSFPVSSPFITPRDIQERLTGTRYLLPLTDFKSAQEKQKLVKENLENIKAFKLAREQEAWEPLRLYERVEELLVPRLKSGREVTFKLSLLLSEKVRLNAMRNWAVWLASKFRCSDTSESDEEAVLLTKSGNPRGEKLVNVFVSVRMDGLGSEDPDPNVVGTTGFMIFLEFPFAHEDLKANASSFAELLLAKRRKNPAVPVLIYLCGEKASEKACLSVADVFQLGKFRLAGYLTDYAVLPCVVKRNFIASNEKLNQGMEWLIENTSVDQIPEIIMPIVTFVEKFMNDYIMDPIFSNMSSRVKNGLLHQGLNEQVRFYNAGIDHLIACVKSQKITSLSWPPPEKIKADVQKNIPVGDWNSVERLDSLAKALSNMKLPLIAHQKDAESSWDSTCQELWGYIELIVGEKDRSSPSVPLLFSKVRQILRKTVRQFREAWREKGLPNKEDFDYRDDSVVFPSFVNLPWTHILHACYSFVLVSGCSKKTSNDPEMLAVCYKDELQTFEPPECWAELIPCSKPEDLRRMNESFSVVDARIADVLSEKRQKRKLENEESERGDKRVKFDMFSPLVAKCRMEKLWARDFDIRLKLALGEDISDEELNTSALEPSGQDISAFCSPIVAPSFESALGTRRRRSQGRRQLAEFNGSVGELPTFQESITEASETPNYLRFSVDLPENSNVYGEARRRFEALISSIRHGRRAEEDWLAESVKFN